MKNILSKIEFHYSYLVVALGFILTGYFNNLIIFTSIILFHELGHIIMCLAYKIKINKVIIYPYGGIIKIEDIINRDIDEELLISIMGVVFQTVYYTIIIILYNNGYIREYIFNLFTMYHYSMLIFNILPIYPLDGFKICNLILAKVFNYRLSNRISIIISIIMICTFFINGINNYSYIMIIMILITNTYKYYKNFEYLYYKFLLERYLYKYNYKKIKIIDNKKKMFKNKIHIFKFNNSYIYEKEYLSKFIEKR